jgi:hypothetical protein
MLQVIHRRRAERRREPCSADVGELACVQSHPKARLASCVSDDSCLVHGKRVHVDVRVDEARQPLARHLGHELEGDASDVLGSVDTRRQRVKREEGGDDEGNVGPRGDAGDGRQLLALVGAVEPVAALHFDRRHPE